MTFGKDRLPAEQAWCPAWPDPKKVESQRKAAFTRYLRPHPIRIGGAELDYTETARERAFRTFVRGAARSPKAAAAKLAAMRVDR